MPAIPLCRPNPARPQAIGPECSFSGQVLATCDALVAFLVQRGGHAGRAALSAEGPDFALDERLATADFDEIADPCSAGGFCRGTVRPYMTGFDRLAGEAARFVEAGRPQPLVEAWWFRVGFVAGAGGLSA